MPAPRFEHSYAQLPAQLHEPAPLLRAPTPQLVQLNAPLAEKLGLDEAWLRSDEGLAMLSGAECVASSKPIAMAYAGHQLGVWVPRLGDGRAALLGEVIAPGGERYDVQLKGCGRTPFSRRGDGKAVLGPVIREYLVSEAMAALGVPTTRALAMVTTGERVLRYGMQPGAVLTRVARSHVRVGTFQYAAAHAPDAVQPLADYVIDRHYPTAHSVTDRDNNRYSALLLTVAERQADLVAHWMGVGFIHGVMNTDNMQIVGETIDYGPCAFMDSFHPDTVFSSIDHHGRYAWSNQPRIAAWNLGRFAEALLPLLDDNQEVAVTRAHDALDAFGRRFHEQFTTRFRAKLGLTTPDGDELIDATIKVMSAGKVDFTLFFRELTRIADGGPVEPLRQLFDPPAVVDSWLAIWQQRVDTEGGAPERVTAMRRHNPVFIPRNHRVEQAINAAGEGDYAPFHRLAEALADPYEERSTHDELERPPESHEVVLETYCGT